jgi:hypothetical protein
VVVGVGVVVVVLVACSLFSGELSMFKCAGFCRRT